MWQVAVMDADPMTWPSGGARGGHVAQGLHQVHRRRRGDRQPADRGCIGGVSGDMKGPQQYWGPFCGPVRCRQGSGRSATHDEVRDDTNRQAQRLTICPKQGITGAEIPQIGQDVARQIAR